ncbi:hypothetical protein AB0D14_44630, partial [Streptomyces sp. NPDC048484]
MTGRRPGSVRRAVLQQTAVRCQTAAGPATSRLIVHHRTGEAGVDYGDKLFWLSVVIQRKYAQICAGFDLT